MANFMGKVPIYNEDKKSHVMHIKIFCRHGEKPLDTVESYDF